MTPPHFADRWLRNIVTRSEGDGVVEPHLDDETLALFAAGELRDSDWQAAVRHLADCASCRHVTSLMSANWEHAPATVAKEHSSSSSRRAWLIPAAAAAMLLVAGLLVFGRRESAEVAERRAYQDANRLLASSDFAQARTALEHASRHGIHSDRLLNLRSQAVRELPGEIALASAGRLMDFGYGVDGVIARGAEAQRGLKEAQQFLSEVQKEELNIRLNRGHLWLSQGDVEQARQEFTQLVEQYPRHSFVWLGLGLAEFLREDWSAAETAFRKAAELDAESLSPLINLTLTLDELDRRTEALKLWRQIADRPLSAADRELVTKAIQVLSRQE